ncbi:MAG TPA: hypothetical protein VFZ66_08160 [Herpetosiphonaceae bacterium]
MSDFINFFIQSDPEFGGVSWATGLFWLVLLATGVYLLTRWRDSNPVRYRFGRQFALVVTVLGVLGLVVLTLNYFQVAPFDIRLWMYLVGLASLGYLGYAMYAYNSKLPAQIAAARPARSVRGVSRGARAYPANGTPTTPRAERPPRPVATTTRREARREKKRKQR